MKANMADEPKRMTILPMTTLDDEAEQAVVTFIENMFTRVVKGDSSALIVEVHENNFMALPLNMTPQDVMRVCHTLINAIKDAHDFDQLRAENPHLVN